MPNAIYSAFQHHFEKTGQKLADAGELAALRDLYDEYHGQAEEAAAMLRGFAELIFRHGVNEDSDGERILPVTLMSIGSIFRNQLDLLEFFQGEKDRIGDFMYSLKRG